MCRPEGILRAQEEQAPGQSSLEIIHEDGRLRQYEVEARCFRSLPDGIAKLLSC